MIEGKDTVIFMGVFTRRYLHCMESFLSFFLLFFPHFKRMRRKEWISSAQELKYVANKRYINAKFCLKRLKESFLNKIFILTLFNMNDLIVFQVLKSSVGINLAMLRIGRR